mmetsp:Transcript_34733/g.79649  ORF Transcript_34733/g.79649 Transcript_34733/m.79649 type:complete len:113 (+) Transcript_34733:65-403(+)
MGKVTRSTHFAKGKRGNKNVKRQRNEGRREAQRKRQKKQVQEEVQRGRLAADEKTTVDMETAQKPAKKAVKPGEGSGTPGAKAAARKLLPWVTSTKKGSRRHKWTWRKFGIR